MAQVREPTVVSQTDGHPLSVAFWLNRQKSFILKSCPICPTKFKKENNYENHISTHLKCDFVKEIDNYIAHLQEQKQLINLSV